MERLAEKRAVRVANCSGYHGDPASEMYHQATLGDVDFITGDYLAEVNMAQNAQAYRSKIHPGFEETAWEGLKQSIDVIVKKRIRVVINGGALNPQGLAQKVDALAREKGLQIHVAYLSGDDVYSKVGPIMPATMTQLPHLDTDKPSPMTYAFLHEDASDPIPMVSAHAYLGARGIVEGLRRGADIIICGRVADASPVIAAAWFWHDWSETDYDRLAGALVAGHLVECSAYVTGSNFSGFDRYSLESLVFPGFPIAEIADDGSCVITKHPNTQGMVTIDTVRCQFLYELQGNVYLNSDVAAHLHGIKVNSVGLDRVRVSGITGSAPPPTTKLAIFYPGGYQAEILLNASGYSVSKKWDLFEQQARALIPEAVIKNLQTLEFQRIGTPAPNPLSQLESTVYLRIFIAGDSETTVLEVPKAISQISLRHFSGLHSSLDKRTAYPRPFLAYYPALIEQSELDEKINFVEGGKIFSYSTGHPPRYAPLKPRDNYDTDIVQEWNVPTKEIRLGDIALARSGDKGGNLNVGIFVTDARHWDWLRLYMSRQTMKMLMGYDWNDSFFIERVEFPRIHAVHFVIYGILGRGVTSSSRLDAFGKGFADYIRDKHVQFPTELLSNLSL
ncbi:hypothetical protein BDV12DRAFT_207160 [Aspergillus spectabilis]